MSSKPRRRAPEDLRSLTMAERDALLRAARGQGEDQYLAIRLTLECANRASETGHLAWSAVDWASRTISIERLKHSAPVTVRVSKALLELLKARMARLGGDLVFPGRGRCKIAGCPKDHVSQWTLYHWMDLAGAKAGLPPELRRFHTLKHTGVSDYAREMAAEGISAPLQVKALKAFTGHKSTENLMVYLQDPETMAKGAARREKALENLP
jgi:integrase